VAVNKTRLNLILVRHGLTDWNEQGRLLGRNPIELNARGRAQVERVAEVLRDETVQAVYSSPQKRTQQTAEAIARVHDLEVIIEPGLDEVWLGRWQGKCVAELRGDPDLERYIDDPTYVCDAIEPASQVQQRAVAFVERLRSESPDGGTFVLVSHGDPLRLLLVYYLSMDLPLFRRLEVDNASINILRFTPRGPKLLKLNTVPGTKSSN
jgi:broad specificity phosphatase PhoE